MMRKKAREASQALSRKWREVGLSISLKAHVMELHTCDFNDKFGVGDKEESFIEQGHQTDIKDDCHYCGLKNLKKTESALRVRAIATHLLVVNQKAEVLHGAKRVKYGNTNPTTKQVKREAEIKKDEKKMKRENYISNSNSKKEE
jgi:hypothetical protein